MPRYSHVPRLSAVKTELDQIRRTLPTTLPARAAGAIEAHLLTAYDAVGAAFSEMVNAEMTLCAVCAACAVCAVCAAHDATVTDAAVAAQNARAVEVVQGILDALAGVVGEAESYGVVVRAKEALTAQPAEPTIAAQVPAVTDADRAARRGLADPVIRSAMCLSLGCTHVWTVPDDKRRGSGWCALHAGSITNADRAVAADGRA